MGQRSEGLAPCYQRTCRHFDVLDRPRRSRRRVADLCLCGVVNYVVKFQTPPHHLLDASTADLRHLQSQRRTTTQPDPFTFASSSAPNSSPQVAMSEYCPVYAPFFGAMVSFLCGLGSVPMKLGLLMGGQGCASAIIFTCELCFPWV